MRSLFLTVFQQDPATVDSKTKQTILILVRKMETFLNGFVGYVFDAAIRTHWTKLTTRLRAIASPARPSSRRSLDTSKLSTAGSDDTPDENLFDVFSIIQYHSNMLDKILSACFLKGRQRSTRMAVQQPLSLILQLATLIQGQAEEGKLEVANLKELETSWHKSLQTLVRGSPLILQIPPLGLINFGVFVRSKSSVGERPSVQKPLTKQAAKAEETRRRNNCCFGLIFMGGMLRGSVQSVLRRSGSLYWMSRLYVTCCIVVASSRWVVIIVRHWLLPSQA